MKFIIFICLGLSAAVAQIPVAAGQINTVSGTGRTLVTTTGAQTPGACVSIDANGNHVATACPSGVPVGTVVNGSNITFPGTVGIETALPKNVAGVYSASSFSGATVGAQIANAQTTCLATYTGCQIIVTQPGSLGSSTLTVGVTGTTALNGNPVELWFVGAGQWTCSYSTSSVPCIELSSSSSIHGLSDHRTEILNSGTGHAIQLTSPSQSQQIHDLWIQGGDVAIKSQGNSVGTDVPGIKIWNIFAQGQTGNAFELVQLSDGAYVRDSMINSSGGSCIRVGILDNGAQLIGPGTNENAEIRNVFCQNPGAKGIWFEPNAFQTTASMTGMTFAGIQISSVANDGFWIKMGMNGVGIGPMNFVGPVGSGTTNTYDAVHLEQVSGGVAHSGVLLTSISQPDATHPRYSIYWNELAASTGSGNEINGSSLANGATAGLFLLGQIFAIGLPTSQTYGTSSNFQSLQNNSTDGIKIYAPTAAGSSGFTMALGGAPHVWTYTIDGNSNLLISETGVGAMLDTTSGATGVLNLNPNGGKTALNNGGQSTATKPTVTGCGTIGTQTGSALSGTFISGAASCTPVLTALPVTNNGYVCTISDQTAGTGATLTNLSSTSSSATFPTMTITSGDKLAYQCGLAN